MRHPLKGLGVLGNGFERRIAMIELRRGNNTKAFCVVDGIHRFNHDFCLLKRHRTGLALIVHDAVVRTC